MLHTTATMIFSRILDTAQDRSIFSFVFGYQPDEYVDCTLNDVCEQLCSAANAYAKQSLKGIYFHNDFSPQLMTAYSKASLLSSICFKEISKPPHPTKFIYHGSQCSAYNQNTSTASVRTNGCGEWKDTFYKYDMAASEWKNVPRMIKQTYLATTCFIEKNKVILAGGLAPESTCLTNTVELMDIDSGLVTACKTKLPINIRFPYIIQVEEKKAILLGGSQGSYSFTENQIVLEGQLSEDGDDVVWIQIKPISVNYRRNKVAFKLENEVIFAYRSEAPAIKSEIYDIPTNTWSNGPEIKNPGFFFSYICFYSYGAKICFTD